MQMTPEDLEAEALRLPPKARAELAHRLLKSIEPTAESEIDRIWLEEAQRRHDEMVAGAAAIPAAEVFAKARARLK